MSYTNPEHEKEGTMETIKQYGSKGYDKAKDLTSQGIAKVKDPEFQEEIKNEASHAWEVVKCGMIETKDRIGEVWLLDFNKKEYDLRVGAN